MATIRIRAYPAKPSYGNGFSVVFHLDGRGDPMPERRVEVRNAGEAATAIEAYKQEAAALGVPLAVSASPVGRAPNGWRTHPGDLGRFHRVNV